ncbi:TrbC/VirB2 family protein [Candidatus Uhrbacteria bacterium]|nr:TrbC/VirB2 family protein [Candidatus Uhrbacteria bacterium]
MFKIRYLTIISIIAICIGIAGMFFFFESSPVFAQNLSNPLGVNSIPELVGKIIVFILGFTGSAALLMLIWGGFLWLTAAGEEARIKAGVGTMVWAVFGLIVIFGAYAILDFIINKATDENVRGAASVETKLSAFELFAEYTAEPAYAEECFAPLSSVTEDDIKNSKCPERCRAGGTYASGWGAHLGGKPVCCCTGRQGDQADTANSGGPRSASQGSQAGAAKLCKKGGENITCTFNILGNSIPIAIARIIKAILGIVGSFALFMFVWGGVLWLTAAGQEQRIKQGWNTMVWAAIGMAVIFGAYAITDFVFDALLQATK